MANSECIETYFNLPFGSQFLELQYHSQVKNSRLAIRLVCIAEEKPQQDTQLKQVGSHQGLKIIVLRTLIVGFYVFLRAQQSSSLLMVLCQPLYAKR